MIEVKDHIIGSRIAILMMMIMTLMVVVLAPKESRKRILRIHTWGFQRKIMMNIVPQAEYHRRNSRNMSSWRLNLHLMTKMMMHQGIGHALLLPLPDQERLVEGVIVIMVVVMMKMMTMEWLMRSFLLVSLKKVALS